MVIPAKHPIVRAMQEYQSGMLTNALATLGCFFQEEPDNPDAHHLFGLIMTQAGYKEAALLHLMRSVELAPERGDYALNAGQLALALNKADRAEKLFLSVVEALPNDMTGWLGLGKAYEAQDRIEDAITALSKGVQALPNNATLSNTLGSHLLRVGRLSEAESHFRKSVELYDQASAPWYNLGNTLMLLHCPSEAREAYTRALTLDPNNAEAHAHLGLAWMIEGELARGWPEYEWRWKGQGFPNRQAPYPLWDGTDLSSQTLLLTTEQGFGDAFQFAQFIPTAAKISKAHIVVEAQAPIADLMASVPGVDDVIVRNKAPLPHAAAQAPLMTLPKILQTTLDDLPAAPAPYMSPPQAHIDKWAGTFSGAQGLKVGLVWRGNPDQLHNIFRSCPVETLSPLLEAPDASFFILQKDATDEERAALSNAIDLSPHLADFADTAAAMHHMDLVITVCTSTAHLAGALGKPAWVMLSAASDWRWFLNRDDCPWYPSARLFRQGQLHDWNGVIADIKTALATG